MRSKRLLAMLLALCLVLSVFSPAVYAVEPGENTVVTGQEAEENATTESTASPFENGLVVSGEDADSQGLLNLRDNPALRVDVEEAESKGDWDATPVDAPDISLLQTETPECIEELKRAAEIFDKEEVVTAFVVMEDAALAESNTSRSLVSASAEKLMLEKQNSAISAIERMVLGGEKLKVRYQFTYLTNSFSIETKFGNLEKIAAISGVKSVFVMPVYQPCAPEDTSNPNTASSGAMTGVHTVWQNLGYTGQGMKIAVIDTGLDLDHPSFGPLDEDLVAGNDGYLTQNEINAVLKDLNAYDKRSSITAETLYRSTKVPYAFNYVDSSLTADHSSDGQGDHGTHVSGIAAANKLDTTSVVGMAPDAQLIVMKVFGASGGAYMDDIVAALEDAMTLGCDVVNASLGSPAGFSSDDEEMDLIYERLASQDIIATISAGNEGTSGYDNMWGTNLNRTQNPDNATVSSPSTYANTFSIASAENAVVMTEYFTLADGSKVFFMHSVDYLYGYVPYSMMDFAGLEQEYVVVPGVGTEEDFASLVDENGVSALEGKIAVVQRGSAPDGTPVYFYEKAFRAQDAGAIGVIIWNNITEDIFSFGLSTANGEVYPSVPVCLVSLEDGQRMADAETKTLNVSAELGGRVAEGGQMSSFSSWGVTPDLRLLPDITGIGGNVYSCYDGGTYGLMSGTSMSAPQVAGVSALVMQYLYTVYPNAPDGTIRDLALALMMSTADPVVNNDNGVEASPRQQGAGLVNAAEAVTSGAYLTVGGDRPKAELGDSSTGKYVFSFEIHNFSDVDKTYTLSGSLLTEDVAAAAGEYFMYGLDVELSGTVAFDKDTVTVPAGGKSNVKVTVTLSEDDKAYFDAMWENGGYVEGYVYLENADEYGVDLNLPFMGFYGDWTDAPVFDTAYWYQNGFWGVAPATGLPEGDQFYHVAWTDLMGADYVLGFNPYSGAMLDANGNVYYDPANNVVSPNGDGALDGLDELYISLLRNAKTLTFTYTVDGEIVHRETIEGARKTMYQSGYGQIVPFLYSWYGEGLYDFTDDSGEALPTGTQVLLTIDANVDYGTGGDHSIQIPITVDTQAPELLEVTEVKVNDTYYMMVEVSENHNLANVALMNPTGSRIYAQEYFYDVTDEGTYLAYFDVTGLGTELMVAVCDYACNEAYYKVTYTSAGENLPEMDTSKLYAYRVYDNYLLSDHMYGWVSMNKPAEEGEYANISVMSDDYLEYAAITAAEYAGGKIFAVDAVYNLVVMDPGLWNRKTVCNLGVSVVDMTFDDSTDTMYVIAKNGNYSSLCTMDLTTGELTELVDYGYYNYAPWAIADDDNGTLYAIKISSANLYTLDAENDYAMVTVKDAEGNDLVLYDSTGAKVSPSAYSQSITYSDGIVYWAYYKYNWYTGGTSEILAIDVANLTATGHPYAAQAYDANYNLVTYYPATELVGMLTLEETDYTIPEATEATAISLSSTREVLGVGGTVTLSATPTPWNFKLEGVEWTSSDETVAIVSGGDVLGVGEGNAIITAKYGDLEATCLVTVVDVDGNLYAYNYYSGDGYYGNMIDVDLATMDYYLVNESPADFLAGDYNGHDGYFYGYTEGGQFYRYDMETNEAVALGDPIGTTPVDMAYDYSTGFMYAAMTDYNAGYTTINVVNLNNGQMLPLGYLEYNFLITLACDTEGTLYGINAFGELYKITMDEYGLVPELLMDGLGELTYMQSMCYDHVNDVLLWAYCEASSIYWIDVNNENPYVLSLGDPTESGSFEFVGMYTLPETVPELADVAVESFEAADMTVLSGSVKYPNATVMPFNATCQDVVWTSSDEEIVTVNANGALVAVAAGTTTITGVLEDEISGQTFEVSFEIEVLPAADDIYGHVLTDLATMGGQYWLRLYANNPGDPDLVNYTDYVIFAEEYYDGKLYAYGYDPNAWPSNWQLFVMDAQTQKIEEQTDLGGGFPFVYDMTYDYSTSTMYALAGAGEDSTDLYVVDMETGALTLLMQTEPLFMSLAAGPDGKLYAMEQSKEIVDEWDPWAAPTVTNANLYTIDPIAGTMELVGDTGMKCNMIASMSYDYDTGYLYWTPLYSGSGYISGLAIVDPATGEAVNLGVVGALGAQVSGLYIVCDTFPEETETLHKVLVTPEKTSLVVGESAALSAITLPATLGAEFTWTSSDENVATVDENGVVTAVGQGKVEITATTTYDGVTMSDSCNVAVLAADASFLAYNITDGGWSAISRADTTVVTNLTEGEDAPAVTAIAAIGNDVYGYDVNNGLFKLNMATCVREYIAEDLGLEVDTENGFAFEVRDMAYDAANDRMLVLGATLLWDPDWEEYSEINSGCALYELDLTTGALELIHTFDEHVYVMAMTVDTRGIVYFYSTFMDYFTKLDLTTGVYTDLITMQTQSTYGDGACDYDMYYDDLTGQLYMLFTSNGRFYKMVTVDAALGTLTVGDYVGEVTYANYAYSGDLFGGLVFVDIQPLSIKIVAQPEDQSAVSGRLAQFSVEVEGENLTYQWQYSKDGTWWFNSGMDGADTATLSVQATASRNSQQYRCVITDADGNSVTTKAAVLTIVESVVEITAQPADQTVKTGETATFTVAAEGEGLTYQWQYFKNGYWFNSTAEGYNTPSVKITATAARDGQQYRCVVKDAYGKTVTSDAATLILDTTVAEPAVIVSQPESVTAVAGKVVKFTVEVEGEGLTYQWQYSKDGKWWFNSGMEGATTATLEVEALAKRDGQQYRCVITDAAGTSVTSDPATLTVVG